MHTNVLNGQWITKVVRKNIRNFEPNDRRRYSVIMYTAVRIASMSGNSSTKS